MTGWLMSNWLGLLALLVAVAVNVRVEVIHRQRREDHDRET